MIIVSWLPAFELSYNHIITDSFVLGNIYLANEVSSNFDFETQPDVLELYSYYEQNERKKIQYGD